MMVVESVYNQQTLNQEELISVVVQPQVWILTFWKWENTSAQGRTFDFVSGVGAQAM